MNSTSDAISFDSINNIEQAFMLSDRFFIFKGGTMIAQFEKNETSVKKLREVLER